MKIIALGASIGDVLRRPALRYGAPLLKKLIPEDYQKWVTPGIKVACKAVAVSIAWFLQRILSAFHSAIRGGEIAGKGIVFYLNKAGFIKVTDDETYADEVAGAVIAFLGFAWQVCIGFRLPFPLNLLLLPATIVDYLIIWFI